MTNEALREELRAADGVIVASLARIHELEDGLRDALELARRWRDVPDETLGRLSAGGSADLDYMGDEMERLTKL